MLIELVIWMTSQGPYAVSLLAFLAGLVHLVVAFRRPEHFGESMLAGLVTMGTTPGLFYTVMAWVYNFSRWPIAADAALLVIAFLFFSLVPFVWAAGNWIRWSD